MKYLSTILKNDLLVVFSKNFCPFCRLADNALKKYEIPYLKINVEEEDLPMDLIKELHEYSKIKTYPNIFVGQKPIGGYREIQKLIQNSKLFSILDEYKIPYKKFE